MNELKSLIKLTESFKKLPTIGDKSAERMAFSILKMSEKDVTELINSIENAKKLIHTCPNCGLLTEDDLCSICSDGSRDRSICIVLSNENDIIPFEKSHNFNGVYHVLGGNISPIKNISPSDLRIEELLRRIDNDDINEIIIATSPTLEGETTALYLANILKDKEIKITRLGYGMPIGGQFEYIDELTITRALNGRTNLK